MYFYAMGIKYDTTESTEDGGLTFHNQNTLGLPSNLMVEADDIDEVVDKISDKTGWLVSTVRSIIPFSEGDPTQVHLEISTDIGYTADFLRQLANEIEASEEPLEEYESFRGVATISWPEGE